MRRTLAHFLAGGDGAVALLFVVGTLKPEWLPRVGAPRTPGTVSILTAPDAGR